MPDSSTPVINDDADRALGRIILRFGAVTFALLIAVTVGMAFVNLPVPQNRLFRYHKPLDLLSILVVLVPFFLGMSRLFAARLTFGRGFVAQRRWREAAAALDPFAGRGQRFLDGSGEAHFLLAQAYAGMGRTAKADAARAFVLKHRPGPWADRLKAAAPRPVPRIGQEKRTGQEKRAGQERQAGQEKRPRPANGKPRRRF